MRLSLQKKKKIKKKKIKLNFLRKKFVIPAIKFQELIHYKFF